MVTSATIREWRAKRAQLLAKYDCHMPHGVYAVIKRIETDIAWAEHQQWCYAQEFAHERTQH